MAEDLNFILVGNEKFYPLVARGVKQIRAFYPSARIWVYDLGGGVTGGYSASQSASLDDNVEVVSWSRQHWETPKSWRRLRAQLVAKEGVKTYLRWMGLKKKGAKRFTELGDYLRACMFKELILIQKPYCMLDCASKIEGKLIFLDADAFIVSALDDAISGSFDVGVTLRRLSEVSLRKNRCQALNSGVVFFNGEIRKTRAFLKAWISEMGRTCEYLIEQTALTRLIHKVDSSVLLGFYRSAILSSVAGDVRIQSLPCERFNFNWTEEDVCFDSTCVLHFKGGRHEVTEFRVIDEMLNRARARANCGA